MAFSKVFALGFSLFVQIHVHRGCIEEERIGLLELKAFVKSNGYYLDPLLPSWVNGTKSECCDWEGVKCSKTTDHLIELSLCSNFNRDNYFLEDVHTWFLNVSLLHPFKELRNLDFSFNSIGGWLGNEGTWKCEPFLYLYKIQKLKLNIFLLLCSCSSAQHLYPLWSIRSTSFQFSPFRCT